MRASVQEIIKKVRQIEIKTWRKAQQGLMGQYHSAMRGQGMVFSEIRPYQFGDEIRRMDWNKTARFQEPFVKVMEEERELTVIIAVDISASMDYGTQSQLKNEYIAEVAATIGLSAANNGDKVGLILYADRIIDFLPPRKGRSHVLAVLSKILQNDYPKAAADHSQLLSFMQNAFKKKSYVFWFSDFNDALNAKAIQAIGRQHQILALQVWDQKDVELPDMGYARITDVETGKEMWVNTGSKKVRNAYAEYKSQVFENNKKLFESASAAYLSLNTKDDYTKALFNQFQKRQ